MTLLIKAAAAFAIGYITATAAILAAIIYWLGKDT
jgi:hypothetical protein